MCTELELRLSLSLIISAFVENIEIGEINAYYFT